MTKKLLDNEVKDLKDLLKKKKLVIGTEKTLKMIREMGITKVYISSNCPEKVKQDFEYYSKLNKFEIVYLKQNNEELGTVCKKPFNISVIGLKKGE